MSNHAELELNTNNANCGIEVNNIAGTGAMQRELQALLEKYTNNKSEDGPGSQVLSAQ